MEITDVRSLLAKWPRRVDLARDIDVSFGMVHQWHNRNRIPAQYHLSVLRAAKDRGIPLSGEDLAALHAYKTAAA